MSFLSQVWGTEIALGGTAPGKNHATTYMPLDIVLTDKYDRTRESVPLNMEEYEQIAEKIFSSDRFPLLRTNLSDYRAFTDVHPHDLHELRNEVFAFRTMFGGRLPEKAEEVMENFLGLLDAALLQKGGIRFIGD